MLLKRRAFRQKGVAMTGMLVNCIYYEDLIQNAKESTRLEVGAAVEKLLELIRNDRK